MTWLQRLFTMTIKELKQLSRDPILLVVIVYFFTADIYIAASGIRLDLRHASLAVLDHDRSATSRELIHRFQPPWFDLKGTVRDSRQALELLDTGKVLAVLDIPPNFERDLEHGRRVPVQMRVDATNSMLGTLVTTYAAQIVARFSQEKAEALHGRLKLETLPRVLDRHRVWYNPNQRDSWFIAISELLTVITMLSLLLPAAAAVREKERGTIEQLAVSPLTPAQILLPKVLSMGLVVLAGTAVSLFLMLRPAFDLPIKGSATLFFAVTALYVFATTGLGLFIATISRSLGQVVMLVILIMMPILLLSGAWTPPEAMPVFLRRAMALSPLSYFIEMAYGILLKGAGPRLLWDSILGLSLLGGLLFGFGVWRFRRQLRKV